MGNVEIEYKFKEARGFGLSLVSIIIIARLLLIGGFKKLKGILKRSSKEVIKMSIRQRFIGIVVISCFILGFLGFSFPALGKEVEFISRDAFLEYVTKEKEPVLAQIYDGLFPTLGYIYVDQWWPRGANSDHSIQYKDMQS